MKLTTLIPHLERVLQAQGDLEVLVPDHGCGCCGYDEIGLTGILLAQYQENFPRYLIFTGRTDRPDPREMQLDETVATAGVGE
ncbi:hypothetical protein ACIGO9_28670 [Nocardia asteroides]|uniref:hypothetical protein n=1 Tax=Nocardia asteroides TaxID=1824 RepID=UPI0037C960CF